MSVTATFNALHTLPFPSVDERYPAFRFISTGTVVGDASGGTANTRLELGLTRAGVLSGLIFGLRTLMADVNQAAAGAAGVQALGWRLTEQQVQTGGMVFPLGSADFGSTISNALKVDTLLGRQSGPAVTAELIFNWENNINGGIYRCYVEGFIWRPIALYAGGPLFPGEFPTP